MRLTRLTAFLVVALAAVSGATQPEMEIAVPEPIPMGTTRGEKAGRLVLRNATVVSGRGSENGNRAMPPEGPIDIIIENGRIVNMIPVDPVNAAGYQEGQGRAGADREIDATGMYVIPGLVEMHAHLRGNGGDLGPRALEYQYLLYMGHGITTLRDAGSGAGLGILTEERRRSAAHEIVAPRLVLCQRWPLPLRQWDVGNTPESAREMVRRFKELGADCVKVSKSPGHYPDVLRVIVEEGKAIGLPVMVDLKVSETDALTASQAGVASIEHWYGIPDAALPHSQNFPPDYNYWDELDRFRWAGALWTEAVEYPEALSKVLDVMIANGTNWDPTMVVYEDNRDLGRAVTLPWHQTLAHPSVIEGLWPNAAEHGAFKREWKTSDEVRWKQNFQIWMRYVKEFHEHGGLLTAGSDTGPMGGPALIRELELLQEAGLHPIDVIRVATTNAAKVLGLDDHCGVRVGCAADLAVVNGNLIDNLKVLYGLGYGFYGIADPKEQWKQGGVRFTIKDGVLYDAPALLREVLWYVQQERTRGATDN
jgi:imidazolonepropionase-like amidohydrolase